MKMTKTIWGMLIVVLVLAGCIPSDCMPCQVTNNTCIVVEFVDASVPEHENCVKPSVYVLNQSLPLCVCNCGGVE